MDFDQLSMKQRVQQFHEKHGGECYSDGAMFYYANGAVRDVIPLGVLMEPPNPGTEEGEWKLAAHKLTFAKLKLAAAVKKFDDLNTRLANTVPADPDAELARLGELQEVVDERKRFLQQAEEAMQNTRWGRRRKEMLEQEEAHRQQFRDFQDRRRAVRI